MGSIYDTRHHLAMRLEAAGIRTLSLYKGMICCLNIDRSRSPLKTRRAGSPVTPGSRGHSRASLTTCVRGKLKQGNFIGLKAVRPSVLYRLELAKTRATLLFPRSPLRRHLQKLQLVSSILPSKQIGRCSNAIDGFFVAFRLCRL